MTNHPTRPRRRTRLGRRSTGKTTLLLGPLLTVALLAGCAGSSADDGAATAKGDEGAATAKGSVARPSASPSPSRSPRQLDPNGFPLAERPDCAADAGGDVVRATTSEGNGVAFLLIGTGTSGVVLAPQADGDICEWLPYAEELGSTYRVALFDWKEPRSELPVLAAAALRRAGVRKVVLGGASQGGALAMSEAHLVRPRPAGVLSFGGELTLHPDFDGRPGIRKWPGPLLAVGSRHDGLFDSADARRLRALHPGPEDVLMVPGNAHGVDLLDDPSQARVRAEVNRFLAGVLS